MSLILSKSSFKYAEVCGCAGHCVRAEQSGVGCLSPTAQGRSQCRARLKSLMLRTNGAMGTHQTHYCSCGREEKPRYRGKEPAQGHGLWPLTSPHVSVALLCVHVLSISCPVGMGRSSPSQGSLHLWVQYKSFSPK